MPAHAPLTASLNRFHVPALFPPARPPRTILVVATRRIGDVLLTTPIVRSLKARWPEAQIDMLVFRGTEGVLENNPDVRRVIVVAQRARLGERLRDAARVWRRYDLACAALSSDRPRFYAWFAGRRRAGLVDPERVTWWTRLMLHRIALNRHESEHTVSSTLALAPAIGIEPVPEVVAPGIGTDPQRIARFDALFAAPAYRPGQPLAVLHPYPMYAYKQWHVDGWITACDWLLGQGFAVALSGGPAAGEREYAEGIAAGAAGPVLNLVGKLSFGESAELFRRASLYIGPDTGATHVAAATGTPTIALFGPSDAVRWGPWPKGGVAGGGDPWPLRGSGRRGNVYLLQGEGECVPCRQEGCERRLDSLSRCLTGMSPQRVIQVAAEMLGLPAGSADAMAGRQRIQLIEVSRPDAAGDMRSRP